MTVTVKYFASLRETMGTGEEQLNLAGAHSVADLIPKLSGQQSLPDNTLVAINQTYASLQSAIKDGDEIAFFPPVTGG